MHHFLQATKSRALVLALLWLVTACGSPAGQQPAPTATAQPPLPSPIAPAAAAATPTTAVLTAVLSQVQGDVTVVETGAAGGQTTRVARPMQVLAAGATVRVPDEAHVGLLCSTEHWIDLTGSSDWQLTEAACAEGRDLPAGTFKTMAPKAGRIVSRDGDGSMVVESQTKEKEGDYGRIPVILSPRNTSLLELAPALRWVEVDGAIEYVLKLNGQLNGRKRVVEITVDAAELDCVDHPLAAPNRICSLPWPAAEWPLEPGQPYFLTVSARTGVAADLRQSEASDLRTLAGDAVDGVEAEIAGIQALNLDAGTQDVLLAGVYARKELYGDAIDAYERALAAQPAPVIYTALGDVYSEVALYRWAFAAYQNALDQLNEGEDDPGVRATAEFGIGRVYYNYADNFAEAARHFEAAMQLYEAAGAPEGSQAAQRALEQARERTQ